LSKSVLINHDQENKNAEAKGAGLFDFPQAQQKQQLRYCCFAIINYLPSSLFPLPKMQRHRNEKGLQRRVILKTEKGPGLFDAIATTKRPDPFDLTRVEQ